MKAVCWSGINKITTETVTDPEIINPKDAILKVRLSSVCGSDLHLLDGYIPTMKEGDIIGHEFIGEVVEIGSEVRKLKKGDRIVVSSVIGCGDCFHCRQQEWSLCDNSNANHEFAESLFGDCTAGIFGYSHAFGGYAGSHAEYIRVPFADMGGFKVPEEISDEAAVFASDALPTGYMAAELCMIQPGDKVAVWGAGGVGLMAMQSAYLLGAEVVYAIDRVSHRLHIAEEKCRAIPLNYEDVDVREALKELTGGRGPDACIDAVGLEAHDPGIEGVYDSLKQKLKMQSGRAAALRQAIHSCRKGGRVSVVGVYGGFLDKFPMGAAMNKGLTLRMGQQHGQRYIPSLFQAMSEGKLDTSFLMTHPLSLDQGAQGYEMFKNKANDCLRVVFAPH